MNQWWARRESNSRSLPCQGNVITPRPRALGILPTTDAYLFTSVWAFSDQDMILEIRPVQFGWEQVPANRVRPLDITILLPFLIGPYVLHFIQNPSIEVITFAHRRICMNPLANKLQISGLDPLLFDVNTGFIERSSKCRMRKRCTAPTIGAY